MRFIAKNNAIRKLIITVTISLKMIGALTAAFYSN